MPKTNKNTIKAGTALNTFDKIMQKNSFMKQDRPQPAPHAPKTETKEATPEPNKFENIY